MMVTIDDETLARAVLTFCLDSADAMMYALVKGTGSAASALQLIADSGPGNHENVTAAACTSLDAAFINGVTRWGRTINARGMASFPWLAGVMAGNVWHRCPARIRTHCETGSQQTARSGSSPRITPVGPAN